MNNQVDSSFISDLVASKLKLPNLKGLSVGYIGEKNKIVRDFFENSIPNKLKNISMNMDTNNSIVTNISFYLKSFCKAIRSVEETVNISLFDICESELSHIVKSSYKSNSLVFSSCYIHCSKKLDFSISEKYNIKCLTFKGWGKGESSWLYSRWSDWIKYPSLFQKIVSAIANCELKSSLQKVDISKSSLSKIEVQKMFDDNGMSHVDVIDEDDISLILDLD